MEAFVNYLFVCQNTASLAGRMNGSYEQMTPHQCCHAMSNLEEVSQAL